MKLILGKKLEMSQAFKADGTVIPVTAVLAGTNVITQVKQAESKDGYNAVQVGFGVDKKIIKSRAGHLKGLPSVKTIKEFKVPAVDTATLKRGDEVTVAVFTEGDKVKVTGTSKGKGFQGVVKRHGFHGSPKTHGHKDQVRMPGSIGAGGVQRVFRGKKMGGHMGDEQVTVSGLEVIAIDEAKNLIYIKGALPGARNGLVMIYGEGVMEIKSQPEAVIEESKEEVTTIEEEVTASAESTADEKATAVKEEIKAEEVKAEDTVKEEVVAENTEAEKVEEIKEEKEV
jgi:large subunit ribosomal protein L3